MQVIKLGHSAYKGTNALRFCFSKAQAVRVLCNRGMTRAKARQAIKNLLITRWATATINYQLIEMEDMTEVLSNPALRSQHGFFTTAKELQAAWKNAPET